MPGLWLDPLMVHEQIPLTTNRRDLFQRTPVGEPAVLFGTPDSRIHMLDPTHPEALEHIRSMIRTAAHKWSYDYLKIDFTYALSRATAFHDPRQTLFQMLRRIYQVIREEAGEDAYVMACVGDVGRYCLGLADATRIGGDQPANWPDVRACLAERPDAPEVHGVWWHNDPDVFYLREEHSRLSLEEARLVTIITALIDGLTLTSDFPDQWDAVRRDLFSRVVPVCSTGVQPRAA